MLPFKIKKAFLFLYHVAGSLLIYRKIPVISPGLIQLRKGFCVGL